MAPEWQARKEWVLKALVNIVTTGKQTQAFVGDKEIVVHGKPETGLVQVLAKHRNNLLKPNAGSGISSKK